MTKTPPNIDADGFRRVDGIAVEGHKSWWKIYGGSTMEIFDDGDRLKISVIRKVAVTDSEFTDKEVIYDKSEKWALPIKLIDDVRRNGEKKIIRYHVTGVGWLDPAKVLGMTCKGEIANARPVFPGSGKPYIRTRRDRELFNNLEKKG